MKRFFILAVLVLILAVLPVLGTSAAEIKIGVIDTQRILVQSKTTTDIRNNFLKELEDKRTQFMEKQKAAQMLEEELKAKTEEMTYEARRDKAELLSRKAKELARMKEEIEAEAKSKDEEMSRKFIREIGEIVREYQKKENYTIILERSTVAAYDDAIDITDEIIQIYDAGK